MTRRNPPTPSSRQDGADPLIASLVALVAVVASPVAQAQEKKKSCARAIINDWYGDGADRQAVRAPLLQGGDPRATGRHHDYSHAPEDILRALAYAKRGQPDPGSGDADQLVDRHETPDVGPAHHTGRRGLTETDGRP